jgi:hypothetical protein
MGRILTLARARRNAGFAQPYPTGIVVAALGFVEGHWISGYLATRLQPSGCGNLFGICLRKGEKSN